MVYKIVAPCAETSCFFDRQIYCFSAQTNGGTSCQARELNWLSGFQNLCLTRRKFGFIVPQDFDFNRKEITRQESHFAPLIFLDRRQ